MEGSIGVRRIWVLNLCLELRNDKNAQKETLVAATVFKSKYSNLKHL